MGQAQNRECNVKEDESEKVRGKLWNKNYLLVLLSNFLLFFAFYLLTPLLPLYLDAEFHAEKDIIGIVLSGYVVATLLVRPFSGFLVDCFDRKKVWIICFFFFFICFAGYVGAGTLLMFAIIRTIHGLPFGAATVANSTVAIDVVPSERRNEGIGYYGLSNNLAMATAPTVGIYLYSLSGNFGMLFWISLVIAFIGLITAWSVKLPQRELVMNKPKISLDHFFLGRAWLMALNIMLFGLCWGIMSNYVAIFGKERLGITSGTGIFFAILSGGLFASRLFGAKKLREGKLRQSCSLGVVISTFGYTLFACAFGEWSYYLSALLIGLGNGRMYPAFLSMFISVARHDQRGTANSSILISWDLGMGLGIVLAGFIAQYISYGAAFWSAAAIQFTGALMVIIVTGYFYERRKLC
ncbi:MAG: MFS transporter [Prevotella sp.]|nr:MFS transporter [Bacteroides sp.]MCM1367047.1 MFS transporter [Prevotella sp.]